MKAREYGYPRCYGIREDIEGFMVAVEQGIVGQNISRCEEISTLVSRAANIVKEMQ